VKVLVVGGGGREHALCWRLAQDPAVTRVLAAPGNAGIAQVAECFPDVRADDLDQVVDLVERRDVELTVVGPEVPLVAGLADALRKRGRNVFGPSAAGARIEGSKAFAKEIMARRGIPTARSGAFDDVGRAVAFVDELGGAAVVKADGLAAGKGVVVASDRGTAAMAIEDCLVAGAYGDAGRTVVVEEVLEGPEVSIFAVTDGKGSCVLLDSAQDHTGGMGCYSPVPFLDQDTATWVLDNVLTQVVDELRPYRGVLYAGLMLTPDGPKVLEFNCRFGDPETQVLLPRMPYGFGTLLHACATGRLAYEAGHAGFDDGAAVTVVIASGGYPGAYGIGFPIHGLEAAEAIEGVTVFHAGTARDDEGRFLTAGGRVLSVTGVGADLAEARARAYEGVGVIHFEGAHHRTSPSMIDVQEPAPLVGVLAASPAELPILRQAGLILEKFDVPHEVRIMSSSRNPDLVDEYARTAFERGLKVIVCSTGLSGHLAAAVAARTVLPVIGVPIATAPQMVGNEALAITAQMPTGVPIATVGVDAAVNAAILAVEILGVQDEEMQARLWKFKDDLAEGLKL